MKGLLLSSAAAVALAPAAAFAGPYVNVESNSGFAGSDYSGSLLEAHIGADITLSDSASAYLQAGPAFVLPDEGDSDTEFSGKAGVNVAMTDKLGAYGEYAFITGDEDLGSNVKLGLKYSF
jgi:opacity protein-like surface antigen